MQLVTRLNLRKDAVVVSCNGEIDMAVEEQFLSNLRRGLQAAAAAAPTLPLIIDLLGISFCASAGLSALLKCSDEARKLNVGLGIIASSVVRGLINKTHTHPFLGVYATIDDGVAALGVAAS